MIPAAVWSTRCLATLFLLGAFATTKGDDPFSVLTGFQQQLSRISSLRATVKRRQTYRDVRRDARGILLYDRTLGTRYEWKTPGHYLFLSSDSLLSGIDLNKRCGWKFIPPDNRLRRQIDPLGRFFRLQSIPPEEFAYRGNSDSLLFFTIAAEHKTFYTIGIEPGSLHCSIIERFGEKQVLLEKTVFTYKKGKEVATLPEAIIITGVYGKDLAVDTITIKSRQLNRQIGKKEFALPEEITWSTGNTKGCSVQQQLHLPASR